MKNRNYLRILLVALSLMLLIGAMVGQTVSAEGEGSGDIYSATIVHDDKISIAFAVKATEAELADGTVAVKYTWGEDTDEKTAVYSHPYASPEGKTPLEGYVWVVTEGVAAYDIGVNANVKSYYNGEVIEERAYSVATYLYNKLYRDGVTGEQKECYEALLAYGAASQAYLDKNEENLVNALDYAYTKNSDVKINGSSSALASEVTLTYTGDFVIDGWIVDGVTYPLSQTTFQIDGVTEIAAVFAQDLTVNFSLGSYTVENGKWAFNEEVSPIWKYEVVMYDSSFTGELIADTYGMTYIIGSDGIVKKMYDGGNGSYYYPETNGTRVYFTGNHVALAFAELEEGDTLVVVPRYYSTYYTDNPVRTWAQGIRWTKYLGSDVYEGSPVGQPATLVYTDAEK